MTRRNKILTVSAITLVVAASGIYAVTRNNDLVYDSQYFSVLTGSEISKEQSEQPVLGIMIENSPPARPQTGLSSAGVVFETITEGGITRFLALYHEDIPEIVAPVRSLRPAFLDWAMGFDASLAHVGGSARALELVDERSAKSLSQFSFEEPYFRTEDREPPHNMSVKTQSLREVQAELNHDKSSTEPFPRVKPQTPGDQHIAETSKDAVVISIEFSSPTYAVEYRYDAEAGHYDRFLATQPHLDAATQEQIIVDNVIVIELASPENGATGEGKATVFIEGTATNATWRQGTFRDRIEFIDSQGNPVALKTGNTWISAVPPTGDLTFRNER